MTPYQSFLLDSLRAQLDIAAGIVRNFPAGQANRELRPGEWNLHQHIAHMRIVNERYLERLEGVLATGVYVPLPNQPGGPDTSESIESMLDAFLVAGRRAADVFSALSSEQWQRVFNHPTIWGDVTVEWWAERYCQHIAEHIDELWMLRQYSGLAPADYQRVTARS